MKGPTYDKEKLHVNLAKYKSHGYEFEVVIDPDAAMKYKKGQLKDVREVVNSENVFHDAKKGDLASEDVMKAVFDTTKPLEVIEQILKKGEIQLTSDQRDKIKEEKKKKIIDLIQRYAVDPRNDTPHPRTRIENAFRKANVHVDTQKGAEEQVQDVVKKMTPILPIKFEVKQVQIHLASQYAAKLYGTVQQFGDLIKDDWQDDGSWLGIVEIPGGLETELYDKLNNATHGEVETKVIKTK